MTRTLALLLIAAFGFAAQAPAGTGSTTKKATTKAVPQSVTIPKGAVANGDGTYSWADKDGMKWTYAKTPFGVMRSRTSDAPVATSLPSNVKVIDEGDKVRFEAPSPFGVMSSEKKKSDLTDDERNLLNSQTAAQNANQAAKQN